MQAGLLGKAIISDSEVMDTNRETKKAADTLRKIFDIGRESFELKSQKFVICTDGASAQRKAFQHQRAEDSAQYPLLAFDGP